MLSSFHQTEGLHSKSSFSAAHVQHEFTLSSKTKMALEGVRKVHVKCPWIPTKAGFPT